ncbi:ATP-binding protein [Micromonospora ureilytica]
MESWTHEEFLAACLQREVAARQAHGGEAAHPGSPLPYPQEPGRVQLRSPTIVKAGDHRTPRHPGLRDGKESVVFLGPPGTGKTQLSIVLGIRASARRSCRSGSACRPGSRLPVAECVALRRPGRRLPR